MLNLRRFLYLIIPAAVLLAFCLVAYAQNADADRAAAMLKQGLAQYKNLDFVSAKATLQKVDRDKLSEADKALLDEHLARADSDMKKQAAALAAYGAASKAMRSGDLVKARENYIIAAASELLPEPVRKEARAQLALIAQKLPATSQMAYQTQVVVVKETPPATAKSPAETEVAELKPEVSQTSPATTKPVIKIITRPEVKVVAKTEKAAATEPVAKTEKAATTKPEVKVVAKIEKAATTEPEVKVVAKTEKAATTEPATKSVQGIPAGEGQAKAVLGAVLEHRAKAMQLLADGKKALAGGDPQTAVKNLQQALALVPEMEEAQVLLKQAQEQLAEQAAPSGPLTILQQRQRIKRQQSDIEFDKFMKRSTELLLSAASAVDFNAAADAVRSAESLVQANKSLYSATEYRDKLTEVETRLQGIQDRRADWEKAQVRKELEQISRAQAERTAKAKEQLAAKISSLTDSAKALREEQKYKEALEVVKQILTLDPSNPWAADQAGMLQQFIVLQEQKSTVNTELVEEGKIMHDLQASRIPWYEMITFPRNWQQIVKDHEGGGIKTGYGSAEDQRIRAVLKEGILPKLDFDDVTLSNAIDHLQTVTGLNIWPNWKYLENAGYTKDSIVSSVHLVKVTYEKALQVILEDVSGPNVGTENEISYVVDGGVLTITTRQDLSRKVTRMVHNVSDLVRAMAQAQRTLNDVSSSTMGFGTTGGAGATGGGISSGTAGGGYGGTGTGTTGGTGVSTGTTAGGTGVSGGTGTLSTTTTGQEANAIADLITTTVDPLSWAANGGPGQIDVFNDMLVVTQTAANHAAIVDLISQLREAKDIQVAIEARFITVNSGFLESIGVDLDFFFNLGSRLGSTHTTDPFTGTIVPQRTGVSGWGTGPPGNNNFTPMAVTQNLGFGNMLGVSSPVPNSIGSQITSPAVSVGGTFLDDIQVNFLLQATQAHQATKTLIAPRITLLNGTAARITVGEYVTYIAQASSAITTGQTVSTTITNVIPNQIYVGTQMLIFASVSHDLKYVTLTILPSISRLNSLTTFTFGGSGDPNDPNNNIRQIIQLPDVASEEVYTTVNVPDGGTLLLGGLKTSGEVEREIGVPLLSKIPIINRAFTNRGKVKDDQTLLILIKPNIIVPRDEEKKQFPP